MSYHSQQHAYRKGICPVLQMKERKRLRGVNGLFTFVVLWFVEVLGLNPSWVAAGVLEWKVGLAIQ